MAHNQNSWLRQIITKGKAHWSCSPLATEVWLTHVSLDINQFEDVNNKNIVRWISAYIIWLIKITVTFQSSADVDSCLYSSHDIISALWISNYSLYDNVVLAVFGPECHVFICEVYILTLVCIFCLLSIFLSSSSIHPW